MDKEKGQQSKLLEYEIQSKLGQGSFGVVYKVKRKVDQKTYVLKQIDISRMSSSQKKEAVLEATILSRINSPYIVKFYDSFADKNQINIVMEYCENGDLGQYLKRQTGKLLTESKIWKFFVEMCLGLQYLHANKILHRDVKTINMFLTKDDRIKIGDLGVAKMLNQTANFAHTVVGTPYYLSPELCEEKPYNHKSDIWSLGCVLYELCTLKHPFESNNQGALILKIVRGKYNPISTQYSKDLSSMVDSCLCKDYKKRPSIQEILEKPIMIEKATYFGYQIQKPVDLKPGQAQPTPQQQLAQQQPSQQLQEQQQKKINEAAAVLKEQQQKQKEQQAQQVKGLGLNPAVNKEKQYYQNLVDARQKQLLQPQPSQQQKKEERVGVKSPQPQIPNNIPSSYIDPSKRQQPQPIQQQAPAFITPQQIQGQIAANKNLLNNNQFDQKEYEKRQQLNLKRPVSNQNPRPVPQPVLQQQHLQFQPNVKQLVAPSQQVKDPPVQPKPLINNQRVKSGAPTQLSRQAQLAQKQGQKIIKEGNDRQQILKPDVKALKPQQSDRVIGQPLIQDNQSQKPQHAHSQKPSQSEIQEVMNLPDDIGKKKALNGYQMKSNQEMIAEVQKKKDVLNRVNNKYAYDISNKSAEELHQMKLVMPSSSQTPSQQSRINDEYSTSIDEEVLIPVGQKQIDDDEFAELLNGGNNGGMADFVKPRWNIQGSAGGMRETQYVPTYEESKDDNDDTFFKVHHDRDNSPFRQHAKMNTIKEEEEGSDTAYFSPENDFNDRDDEDGAYDSGDEIFKMRMLELGLDPNDEDNQPYDQDDNKPYAQEDNQPQDQKEEERRQKEEFGDDEEEEEIDPLVRMSMTKQQQEEREVQKLLQKAKNRSTELKIKLDQKMKEGHELVGHEKFKECLEYFKEVAAESENMAECDFEQIQDFLEKKTPQAAQILGLLFQAYYMLEELNNNETQIQELTNKQKSIF